MSDPSARELDCLTCGACCRTGHDGRILVPAEDIVRWKRIGREDVAGALQPGHFGEMAFATDDRGACVHLGTAESPNACAMTNLKSKTMRFPTRPALSRRLVPDHRRSAPV